MVLEFEVVGFERVLQQMPLWVTEAPPSFDMLPPLFAVVWVMEEMDEVEMEGN
jgi:hypothetical protein